MRTRFSSSDSRHGALAWLVLIAGALLAQPFVTWPGLEGGHDQARWLHIALIGACGGVWALRSGPSDILALLAHPMGWCLLGFFALGLASVFYAAYPVWAWMEWSLWLGSLVMAWAVGAWVRDAPREASTVLWLSVLALSLLLTFRGALLVGFALWHRAWPGADLVAFGFSNMRHFSQIITPLAPILLWPWLCRAPRTPATPAPTLQAQAPVLFGHPAVLPASMLAAIGLWWMAFHSGSRASLVGLFGILGATYALGPQGRPLRLWVSVSAAIALVLHGLLQACTALIVTDTNTATSSALVRWGSSGRLWIWQESLLQSAPFPGLGLGPMHLASLQHLPVAHPHNAWIQWVAEWGWPATACISLAIFLALRQSRQRLSATTAQSASAPVRLAACLWAGLVGSLCHAMVDGVLVMPYTVCWLAVCAGWLMGLLPPSSRTSSRAATTSTTRTLGYALAWALCLQGWALAAYTASMASTWRQNEACQTERFGRTPAPRFWKHGHIGPAQQACSTSHTSSHPPPHPSPQTDRSSPVAFSSPSTSQ